MSAFQDKTIQSLDGPPPADYPDLQAPARQLLTSNQAGDLLGMLGIEVLR